MYARIWQSGSLNEAKVYLCLYFTESGYLNGRNVICIYLTESGSLNGSKVIYMPVFDKGGA
jgi:hypothetical protein